MVAAVISGPMPSPSITTMRTGVDTALTSLTSFFAWGGRFARVVKIAGTGDTVLPCETRFCPPYSRLTSDKEDEHHVPLEFLHLVLPPRLGLFMQERTSQQASFHDTASQPGALPNL